jgi:hypothetical protein
MLVVILNDGETYTDLEGSRVLRVPDDTFDDDVDSYVKNHYDDALELKILVASVQNLLT